jgi:twitching motility two-component system response regulator PilH
MAKILIVDDASADRIQLERLVAQSGHTAVCASSAEEALAKARAELPALVFMDVNMPGTDGFTAARQLSSDPKTKNIPVVFVTAKNQKADRVFAQILGARSFISKPYTPEQIKEQLSGL